MDQTNTNSKTKLWKTVLEVWTTEDPAQYDDSYLTLCGETTLRETVVVTDESQFPEIFQQEES